MELSELFDGVTEQDSIVISGVPDGTRIIVTSDHQIPFQDDLLLDVIYGKFAKDFKPKTGEYHNFLNGDFLDLFGLSRFPARVTPKGYRLGIEIDMGAERLKRWGKPFTHRHFVFGNHEARWDKALYEGSGALSKWTKPLHEALGLEELGYDWVPYPKHYDFEGFIITHGNSTSKYAASMELMAYHRPGTSGHVNRPQDFTYAAAANGDPITWYCTGMMCVNNIGDVIKDWGRKMPWQQAFGIGEVSGGVLHYQLVRVHHGGFWANGKFYTVEA